MTLDKSTSIVGKERIRNGVLSPLTVLDRIRLVESWWLFPFFTLLLLLFAWSTTVYLIKIEYTAAIGAATLSSRELADTYEAQVVRNLALIDQTLKLVAYTYLTKGDGVLKDLRQRDLLPPAIVFRITISTGDSNKSTSTYDATSSVAATEPLSADHPGNNRNALFIGCTGYNPNSGTHEITFSRRLVNTAGKFVGVVMLAVDPAYFTSGYDVAQMGKDGFIGLLGTDGIMRAQQVGDSVSWGTTVSVSSNARLSELLGVMPWDRGVKRFSNIRALRGFPLIAIVGLSHEEALTHYRRDRRLYTSATAVGSLLLIAFTVLLSLRSRELMQSRVHAHRIQQTFYAAWDRSLDAFFVWECVYSGSDHSSTNNGFVLLDVSRRGVEITGSTRDILIGSSLTGAFWDAGVDRAMLEFTRVFETGNAEEFEWLYEQPDGAMIWLYRQVVRVDNGVVAIVRDISPRKRAEGQRAEQHRILEMIATKAPLEGVLSSLMRLLESQIVGSACSVLLKSDDGQSMNVAAAPSLPVAFAHTVSELSVGAGMPLFGLSIFTRVPVSSSNLSGHECCGALLTRSGMAAFNACRSVPILSDTGDGIGAIVIFTAESSDADVTEVQTIAIATAVRIAGIAIEGTLSDERIYHMARHDALTGLPNRTMLSDHLNEALQRAQQERHAVLVIFVDLDHFKLINDSLGHQAGDELLKTVARRMKAGIRHGDIVVRLGGDEFVLILRDEEQSGESARVVIERLRSTILEPIELSGQKYQVTCSLGIASYPADGRDAETLLMNADLAMYHAKERGRNNSQSYAPDLSLKVRGRLQMQKELSEALANNEFRLVYQPQFDTRTGKIFGVEALLRWHHPRDGSIPPATFIPLAEETGLILLIGEWVLRTACQQCRCWHDDGLPQVTVSVNVSATQFLDRDWIATVTRALDDSRLDPHYLGLELTENVIINDLEGCIQTMQHLQTMGMQLSIDDFGTGYSSLSALKRLPIARLKIDGSFVHGLPQSEGDRAIVAAVISLSRQLNLSVIAEGVETRAQAEFLGENGCYEIQGYHFSKPVDAIDIEIMLREQRQGKLDTWPQDSARRSPVSAP